MISTFYNIGLCEGTLFITLTRSEGTTTSSITLNKGTCTYLKVSFSFSIEKSKQSHLKRRVNMTILGADLCPCQFITFHLSFLFSSVFSFLNSSFIAAFAVSSSIKRFSSLISPSTKSFLSFHSSCKRLAPM